MDMLLNKEMTTGVELEKLAKSLKLPLKGIVFRNQLYLHEPTKFPTCYIINLDDVLSSGTHWTCLYLTNKTAYYFDSFGVIYPQSVEFICKKLNIPKIYYNEVELQNITEGFCGQWVIAFLYHMKKTNSIIGFKSFIAQFQDTIPDY